MPADSPIEAEQVHHLDVDAGRGSRLPSLVGLVLLLVVAGGGAWFVLTDPLGGQAAAEPPPPSADNLLGQAWSFESTESGNPLRDWMTPDDAPAGFDFTAAAAVSGAAGAAAITNEGGWSRILLANPMRATPGTVVEYSAVSASEGIQLLLRFEGEGLPPFDVVAASGRGAIGGRVTVPPGFQSMRAGLGCVGPGSADDLLLRTVEGESTRGVEQGVFDLTLVPSGGLLISRDLDLLLLVEPTSVRLADGSSLPGAAARLPGEGALALPDGSRVSSTLSVESTGGHQKLVSSFGALPADAVLVTHATVLGALADAPLGVRAGGRYDRFTDDFRADDVDSLVLGRTQDRLVLDMAQPFSITATYGASSGEGADRITLLVERRVGDTASQQLLVQAGFQEERVAAAGLLDAARADEAGGRLGACLAALERIVAEFPFDEQVLADASADRARLTVLADERLTLLRADLEDALFLGNPQRCRDVRDAAEAQQRAWSGSPVSEQFGAFVDEVDERAGRILSSGEDRRLAGLRARLESFRQDGRFPSVVAEMEAALAALEAADEAAGESGR